MNEHIVFGISPFNTKFDEKYIFNMLDWGFSNFTYVDVIHPHEEARYLLLGCGNSEMKAKKKSRKEYSRVARIVDKYLTEKNKLLYQQKIIKFSDFYNADSYNHLYDFVKKEYSEHSDFREICIQQTQKAVQGRKNAIGISSQHSEELTLIAMEYIFKEIPYILAPAEIFSLEHPVCISYYSKWDVAEYIYKYGKNISPSNKTQLIIKDHV